jgi:mitogen-activated protein kinase kinase
MSDPKPARANPLTGLHKGHPTSTPIPPSLQAKMAAFANRPSVGALPVLHPASSFPAPPKPHGMAARRARPNFSLRDIDPAFIPEGPVAAGLGAGRPSLFQEPPRRPPPAGDFGSPFSNFSKIVSVLFSLSLFCFTPTNQRHSDPSGALNFNGKAVLHATGVNFSNGASFAINMDQLQLDEELGKGNYGTVKKVLHKPTNVAMAMKVLPHSLHILL